MLLICTFVYITHTRAVSSHTISVPYAWISVETNVISNTVTVTDQSDGLCWLQTDIIRVKESQMIVILSSLTNIFSLNSLCVSLPPSMPAGSQKPHIFSSNRPQRPATALEKKKEANCYQNTMNSMSDEKTTDFWKKIYEIKEEAEERKKASRQRVNLVTRGQRGSQRRRWRAPQEVIATICVREPMGAWESRVGTLHAAAPTSLFWHRDETPHCTTRLHVALSHARNAGRCTLRARTHAHTRFVPRAAAERDPRF